MLKLVPTKQIVEAELPEEVFGTLIYDTEQQAFVASFKTESDALLFLWAKQRMREREEAAAPV